MKLLIIGGTAFLGKALVARALELGHDVTLFNRGMTSRSDPLGVRVVHGHRSTDLSRLHGERWDSVIDTCAYSPDAIRSSGTALSDQTEHYALISSQSVYRSFATTGIHESSPILDDGPVRDGGGPVSAYGVGKAMCERAAQVAFDSRLLTIRLGFVIGPYDYMPRLPLWLRRAAAGGRILAPGTPERYVQLIDVRDAAAFIMALVGSRATGTFNVTGIPDALTVDGLLGACIERTGSDGVLEWIDDDFLIEAGCTQESLPFWRPHGMQPGFFSLSVTKALADGLEIRSIAASIDDTYAWLKLGVFGDDAAARVAIAGTEAVCLSPEREADLLLRWATRSTRSAAG